jgi:hypothetical protein
MSSKRKAPASYSNGHRTNQQNAHTCPNPLCQRTFAQDRNLRIHLAKTNACTDALFRKGKTVVGSLDVSFDLDTNNTNFEPNEDVDETAITPWATLEPWDSTSEEASSSSSLEDSDTEDDADVDNLSNDPSIPPEFVMAHGLCFTPSDYAETKLLKLLNDAHAPHFLYQDVLNWVKEAKQLQYDFRPQRTTRRAQIKYIEKLAQLQYCRPETIQLTLPGDGKVVPVTRFPFINMLYSLLSDPDLVSDLNNLDVNTANPFGKYESEGNYLSTVNSGAWYQQAYNNLVIDPEKDFLVPICFACDETKLKGKGKTGCWPLLFSTTIFNQALRNKASAWRPLGYIYDTNIIDSKQERKDQSNEYKGKRLHAIFHTVLETFIEAQNSGMLDNITLTLGGQQRVVNLRIPCIFIIGDMQGGDKICCSSAGYSNKMARLCRKCNVKGAESGDPFIKCKRMSMVKIRALVDTNNVAALQAINQYNVHSAWFDVGYGGCRYGIFSAAAPVEALHALENGLIPDGLKILFVEEMTAAQLRRLDQLAKRLHNLPRQKYLTSGSEPLMPRLRWSDGISSLTDLEAKYKVGIMFTIVAITLQDDGAELFAEVLGSSARVAQMRQVFQMMLCYWVWLKKDKYWQRGDKEAKQVARTAIQTMLNELITLWPREQGQGWEKAKVHEQLHVPDDIERNGAPAGWHSGPTENNHIATVKNFASQTNRRRETLDAQIGSRNAESFIINTAFQKMTLAYSVGVDDAVCIDDTACGMARTASKAMVYLYKTNRVMSCSEPQWQGVHIGPIHPWLTMFLQDYYALLPGRNIFDGISHGAHAVCRLATEYTRGGQIFRANPNYRQGGPWYDWTMFRWAKEGVRNMNRSKEDSCVHYGDDEDMKDNYTYAPGQILGFLVNSSMPVVPGVDDTLVIVLCCASEYRKSSVFSTYWKVLYTDKAMTKPMIRAVSPDSIVRHCLMLPENDDWNGYHEIWSRERWGDEFCVV